MGLTLSYSVSETSLPKAQVESCQIHGLFLLTEFNFSDKQKQNKDIQRI